MLVDNKMSVIHNKILHDKILNLAWKKKTNEMLYPNQMFDLSIELFFIFEPLIISL